MLHLEIRGSCVAHDVFNLLLEKLQERLDELETAE